MATAYEVKSEDGNTFILEVEGREVMRAERKEFIINVMAFAGWLLGEAAEIMKKDV